MPRRDVDVRAVAWTGLAIGATIVVVVVVVYLLLHLWRVSPGADRLRLPYVLAIDGAKLESAPQPELRAARAAKAHILATSGWVDDAHGIVRIPIETAMRVLVARGATVATIGAAGRAASAATAAGPEAAAPSASAATSPSVAPTSEAGSTR